MRAVRREQSSASSFSFQYLVFSFRSSVSSLRRLPRLPSPSVFTSIFYSVTCFREQFQSKTYKKSSTIKCAVQCLPPVRQINVLTTSHSMCIALNEGSFLCFRASCHAPKIARHEFSCTPLYQKLFPVKSGFPFKPVWFVQVIAPPLIIVSLTAIIRPRAIRFVPGILIGDCRGGYL